MIKTLNICWEPDYKPTEEEEMKAVKQIESFVGYIRMTEELKDLRRTFNNKKTYTGEMVKQVIDSRLKYLRDKEANLGKEKS